MPTAPTFLPANAARALAAAVCAACALVLAGCASPVAAPASSPTLQPNVNLLAQGIPPIPMSLVREVEAYTEFRGHGFVDWHPTRREMLVAHRQPGASTSQVWRVASPLGTLEPVTDEPEPVTSASYEPREGRYLVFERASGGNEATQLYRLDLPARKTTLLTDPGQRHDFALWLRGSSRAVFTSVPLDRTAPDGRRADPTTTLSVMDPLQPGTTRRIAELPGVGWVVGGASHDERRLALLRYRSANVSEIWLIDVEGGAPRQLLPAAGAPAAVHYPVGFTGDDRGYFFVSDRAGEFTELMRLDLASGAIDRITGHIPWNVEGAELTRDGSLLALRVNVDGRDELRLIDARTLRERALPAGLPAGSVSRIAFDERRGELALAVNSAQSPSQLFSLDVASGRVEPWTRPEVPPGLDPSRFSQQRVVRWTSFDGRTISGLLNMPPARFTGKRPVLIEIHGGPEAQAKVGFMGRYNHFIDKLGIAVIQPNVRGSRGYGKTFLALDNGLRREDAVKDIGALLDWIARQPDLDASRVLVSGGSYGGYMSLASAVHYGQRLAGAIDVVGISHFVTFLESTESYRRDLRRVEYGDEREPAMRAFLDRISPLTQAARIQRPLFVVQGRNDPRVPYTEAEQIVARARGNGTPVWYLRVENEGHGFARKENADFQFYATIRFLEATLLAR